MLDGFFEIVGEEPAGNDTNKQVLEFDGPVGRKRGTGRLLAPLYAETGDRKSMALYVVAAFPEIRDAFSNW